MTDPVDRHVRALMARLHEMTPLPPTFDELTLTPRRRSSSMGGGGRRRAVWAVATAALFVVVVGVAVFVATRGGGRSTFTGQLTTSPSAASVSSSDVVGLWVFERRAVQVDEHHVGTGWPLHSPLPAHRYEPDGTVHGFDGCIQTTETWELVDGTVQTPLAPNNTGGATADQCLDKTGNAVMAISAVPNAVSVFRGVPTLVHSNADGSTAIAVRVDGLPSPATLAGTSWTMAIDGDDLTISFRNDDTVDLATDAAACSSGRYDYADRLIEVVLSGTESGCGDQQLTVLTSGPLLVTTGSDAYGAGTLLLASDRGAVRLVPPGTVATGAEPG